MRESNRNATRIPRKSATERLLILLVMVALCGIAGAQQAKNKTSVTGRYDGTAKNKAGEVITVSIDLTEKEGALSGTINSSHGNFTITGGSRQGEAVTIEFDAGGPGTISLHPSEDRLVGTWSAGDDGGAVDVKKVAAPEGGAKGKGCS